VRIQVENVSFAIQGKPILSDVSFRIAPGESVALIGPNGSGKSTLLRVIAGLIKPALGQVLIGDETASSLSPRNLAQRLGVVAQDAKTSDAITVEDAVKLGRTPWLSFATPYGEADKEIVENALQEMVLGAFHQKRFNALSGGERQRVHISRVLAQTPKVFLLDEPTNHLDIRHQLAIMKWVSLQRSTVLLALHDLNQAYECDKVAILEGGRLVAFGPPQDVIIPEVIEPVFNVGVHQTFSTAMGKPILTFTESERRN
jgi:iron complex transport system ATP-binding protein